MSHSIMKEISEFNRNVSPDMREKLLKLIDRIQDLELQTIISKSTDAELHELRGKVALLHLIKTNLAKTS